MKLLDSIGRPVRMARAANLVARASEEARLHAGNTDSVPWQNWQLGRLNALWTDIAKRVPYYRNLCDSGQIPGQFSTWDIFRDTMPIIDRRALQRHGEEFRDPLRAPEGWRSTGGSTAEPIRIPIWRNEIQRLKPLPWIARAWFGVVPSDRLFLMWGHAHLFGDGILGHLRKTLRGGLDRVLGYHRQSVYDLGEEALRRAGQALLEHRPRWVLGYSVALDRFARVNEDRAERIRALKVRVVIATAEAFPRSDSRQQIADVFGCPVAMEYGAVETGPIGHERPEGGFASFWRYFALEGIPSQDVPGAYDLVITALYPRCLPLLRYQIGDIVTQDPRQNDIQGFERVLGRCNDTIRLSDDTRIHSETFTHVVRDVSEIEAYEVVQSRTEGISLAYVARSPLGEGVERKLRDRLARVHPELAGIILHAVDMLPRTIAGKSRPIRREL